MSRKSNRFLALCVAAAVAVGVASTAQAVDLRSWDQKTNDANKRFIVLASFNNQAVLDKETQLVWERSPRNAAVTWKQADFDTKSEPSCALATTGGRQGWRLPRRFELMSLSDPSVSGSAQLPVGHPFTGISPDAFYWTSDLYRHTDAAATPKFWSVKFEPGSTVLAAIAMDALGIDTRIWCVRGQGSPGGF